MGALQVLHIYGRGCEISIITARKRSLGQGNIFTPVCHSVHTPIRHPPPRDTTGYGQQEGGTHPTLMHTC